MRTCIADLETNGLLPPSKHPVSKIHSLVIRDVETGDIWSFVANVDIRRAQLEQSWETAFAGCRYVNGTIEEGLAFLAKTYDRVVWHNGIDYDLAVLKLLLDWEPPEDQEQYDSILMSRLLWPELFQDDWIRIDKKGWKFPKHLCGRHSLEAWGHRFGEYKGDYKGGWAEWSWAMQDYCIQDTAVTLRLYQTQLKKDYAPFARWIEHEFAKVIALQQRHGWPFDEAAANKLYADLIQERDKVHDQLRETIKPWWKGKEKVCNSTRNVKLNEFPHITKRRFSEKTGKELKPYVGPPLQSWTEGARYTEITWTEFNPGSRAHIEHVLRKLHGWEPHKFGKDGKATCDETVLSSLDYPEAELILRWLTMNKRVGMIAGGKEAFLKHLQPDGRIHGKVDTAGAVTRRCTHSKPNVAQCQKVQTTKDEHGNSIPLLGEAGSWGYEFRSLFTAMTGFVLVGADASGLELRNLGHYMARHDGGAYAKEILEGDIHSVNCRALGMDPKKSYPVRGQLLTGRDIAKTFIYAFLYGAGDEKLGKILGITIEEARVLRDKHPGRWKAAVNRLIREKRKPKPLDVATIVKGGLAKARFLKNVPALGTLQDEIKSHVSGRYIRDDKKLGWKKGAPVKGAIKGHLRGIDGGLLRVRHQHAALNTLLQSAGAIAVKLATVYAWHTLRDKGLVFGEDYALVGHIHDELQLLVKEGLEDEVGQTVVDSIKRAGERLKYRCPLDGEYKVGRTWADTH